METKDFLYENAKALFNNAPFGYFSCNKDLVLISANNTFLHWINSTTDIQNTDKKLTDFFSGEALDQLAHLYLPTLFSKGFVKDFAINLTVPNAKSMAILLNSDVCKDASENIILIRTTATTITHEEAAYKETEAALIEANLQLELAQKVAKTGHWTFNPQTEKYNFSKECLRIFGFDNDFDSSYAMFMGIIHPDDVQKIIETSEKIIAGETAFQIDHRIVLKNGSIRWINTQSIVDRNDTTGQMFLRGTSQDITDRKKAEEIVRNSEEKYRLIVETAQEGIWMIDKHDSITFVNGAMANMLGYTVDEMMGKELFYFMDEEGKQIALNNIERRKQGIKDQHEFCFLTKSKEKCWVLIETGPIFTNGEYDGALAMIMNIDDRKKADEEIKQINETLELKIIDRTKDLYEKKRLLKEAQKIAKMGSWEFDLVTGKVNWTTELFDIFGLEEINGAIPYEKQYELFAKDDWQKLDAAVNKAITLGEPYELNLTINRKNGTPGFVFAKGEPTKDSNGDVIRLTGIIIDITERKKLEENWQITIKAFETAIEGIIICDAIAFDQPIIYTNDAFNKITGYTQEDVVGKNCRFLQGKDTDKNTVLAIKQKLQSEQIFKGEILNYKKDGTPFWNLLRLSPVVDNTGKVTHIVGFQYDITERKKNETNLQLITERFQIAKKSASIGVWDWDVINNILLWDEEMYKAFNVLPAAFSGAYEAWLSTIHPDDFDKSDKAVQESLSTGKELDIEFRIIWPDKSIRFMKGNAFVQHDETGKPIRMIGANWDITTHKNLEIKLEKSRKELEAFSYSVSHDLRAPLRGIDGWSLALLEDYGALLDETANTYLHRVRNETQKMGILIDELLKLSRISKTELKTVSVNLTAIAHTIVNILIESNKTQKITAHIDENLITNGDYNLLEIMLTNLFNNAIKFCSKQPETIIYFGKIDINGSDTFYIKDNGVGFDNEKSAKMFGAFQRMHKQTDFGGNGIGLATVQRIIHMHNGNIWAEAAVNKGATFFFALND